MKTQVLRRNHQKPQKKNKVSFENKNTFENTRKQRFGVGTYGNNKNKGFALEPRENIKKTKVLRGNQWKTKRKTQVLFRNLLKTQGKQRF